tara:strand:- start:126 stop:437 length:312 start_codon:yes stop_codon:yes gene_type:complete
MSLKFKAIIEDYCGRGTLSDEEVDFLEREHIKTMNTISEILSPSIAHWNICEACNLEQGSYWITCNASILDRIRPVRTGKPRAHKLFDALCKYKLYKQNPNLQ